MDEAFDFKWSDNIFAQESLRYVRDLRLYYKEWLGEILSKDKDLPQKWTKFLVDENARDQKTKTLHLKSMVDDWKTDQFNNGGHEDTKKAIE